MKKSFVIALILTVSMSMFAQTPDYAGLTIDKATVITDTVELLVQDGDNYIKLMDRFLPATVTYLPDTAFGPLPIAILDRADTLDAQMAFDDCRQQWRWTVEQDEETHFVDIFVHENARILVEPTKVSYVTENRTQEHACDSFLLGDKWVYESGEYITNTTELPYGDKIIDILELTVGQTVRQSESFTACMRYESSDGKVVYETPGVYQYSDTVLKADGCNKITTHTITVEDENCLVIDTIYFCRGLNTQHEEQDGNYIRRYEPYEYESPSEWDYMDGVVLQRESEQTLADLLRAEQNLYEHYVGGLTPISRIAWSHRPVGASAYQPLTVENQPQWIPAGMLAVQIRFLCGEVYNNEFPTDIETVGAGHTITKCIEDGRVVILRGGEKYNVLGIKMQ